MGVGEAGGLAGLGQTTFLLGYPASEDPTMLIYVTNSGLAVALLIYCWNSACDVVK